LTAAAILGLVAAGTVAAVSLKPETEAAFDQYLRNNDARIESEIRDGAGFLWIDRQSEPERRMRETGLRQGQLVIEDLKPGKLAGGLIHHWLGIAFVSGVRLEQAVALLLDYDRYQEIHRPYFLRSRLLERNGGDSRIHLRLYKKKTFASLVTDTEHAVHYQALAPDRAFSRSHSTKVVEIDDAGETNERPTAPGDYRGYLWRHVSYWRLIEKDGGTYLQLEALSLSRDLPTGTGWVLGGFLKGVHKEFLVDIVRNTRAALAALAAK